MGHDFKFVGCDEMIIIIKVNIQCARIFLKA